MSRFRDRLKSLQRATSAVSSTTPDEAFRARLAQRGRGRAPRRPDDRELARRLNAKAVAPGLLLREEILPRGTRHAQTLLCPDEESLHYFGAVVPAEEVVYLDTETTGIAGGAGTLAFLVGVARFQRGRVQLRQYLVSAYGGEAAMLEALSGAVDGAAVLVSFNGRSFDVPLLSSRFRLQALPDPLKCLAPLDLLHLSRRAFARHWPDCRLATVERRLLGLSRQDDLPGAQVPAVWRAWLQRACIRDLPRVLCHNRLDVLSLVALPGRLAAAYREPHRWQADYRAAARLNQAQGEHRAALEHLRAHRPWLSSADALEMAELALRCEDTALALSTWEALAQDQHPGALKRLAVYFERREPDLQRALMYTRRLLALAPEDADVRRREARLLARLDRLNQAPGPGASGVE